MFPDVTPALPPTATPENCDMVEPDDAQIPLAPDAKNHALEGYEEQFPLADIKTLGGLV